MLLSYATSDIYILDGKYTPEQSEEIKTSWPGILCKLKYRMGVFCFNSE